MFGLNRRNHQRSACHPEQLYFVPFRRFIDRIAGDRRSVVDLCRTGRDGP